MLNTPIIKKIAAFDPSKNHTISFQYSGNQVIKNRVIILDNETYQTVYDSEQERMRLDHVITANSLHPGKAYSIKVKVYDNYGDESDFSSPVLFYCFTSPIFQFENISENMIYRTSSLDIILSYSQVEGEIFRECQINLYGHDYAVLSSSPTLYDSANIFHTFHGLKNENVYYVRAYGKTVHDMDLDTGYIKVNVQYFMMPANVLFEVKNHPELGAVSLSSGIIDIGYEVENDNYTFSNGELTIFNNSLTYNNGFSAPEEFSCFVKARKLIPGVPFIYLKNPYGGYLWLEIQKITELYYCVLNVPYALGTYTLYKELPKAMLTCENGEILVDTEERMLMLVNLDYVDGYTTVFEAKYKFGLFGLEVYYEDNATTEEVI